MKEFTLRQAVEATGGVYHGKPAALDEIVSGVVIDNRNVTPGAIFVPIKGDRFDGHDFIPAAYEAGALCCVTEKPIDTKKPFIQVEDPLCALQGLAEFYRSLFKKLKIVGITGSVGKTTTKEMITCVLSRRFNVLKTEGNLNNQTGVPLTVFRLDDSYDIAVIEMGTNHFGEIKRLAKIVKPDVALLTNIGTAHIEHLGSKEGILEAKSEMFEYLAAGGKVLLNGDDPLLRRLKNARDDAATFGLNADCNFHAENIHNKGLRGLDFTICYKDTAFYAHIPSPGEHMVQNALAAAAVGRAFGMEYSEIAEGLAAYRPVGGRMAISNVNDITVLNDTYNANPQSMETALEVLSSAKGRKVAILGDMYELGEGSQRFHYNLGKLAVEKGVELTICVGGLAEEIYRGVVAAGGSGLWFETQDELLEGLHGLIQPGDTVLVKASRGMRLELTVEELLK